MKLQLRHHQPAGLQEQLASGDVLTTAIINVGFSCGSNQSYVKSAKFGLRRIELNVPKSSKPVPSVVTCAKSEPALGDEEEDVGQDDDEHMSLRCISMERART